MKMMNCDRETPD